MKPTDEVTITTTLGDLAKVYAIMGYTNGKNYGRGLYRVAKSILDPEGNKTYGISLPRDNLLNYSSYQRMWERAFFREEVLKLSVAEIEEKYGCKVKIVDKQS